MDAITTGLRSSLSVIAEPKILANPLKLYKFMSLISNLFTFLFQLIVIIYDRMEHIYCF